MVILKCMKITDKHITASKNIIKKDFMNGLEKDINKLSKNLAQISIYTNLAIKTAIYTLDIGLINLIIEDLDDTLTENKFDLENLKEMLDDYNDQ